MSDRNADNGWLIAVRTGRPDRPTTEIFAVAIDDHDLAIERLRAQRELPDGLEIVAATEMYSEALKDFNMVDGDVVPLDSFASR
jgi:hypothetical protein